MKFSIATIAFAALLSTANACKCIQYEQNAFDWTRACCGEENLIGDDCPAHFLRNDMKRFSTCCKGFRATSDCHCPKGC
ncbi:hypothetical protein PT974_11673 [Cladobotryum mycophilum]|uniref:Uncharacterized protein n=1 Tax=Cladobotryum mycophilum TaxID=491253 RepID=A0ABR0S6U3_9HYPO